MPPPLLYNLEIIKVYSLSMVCKPSRTLFQLKASSMEQPTLFSLPWEQGLCTMWLSVESFWKGRKKDVLNTIDYFSYLVHSLDGKRQTNAKMIMFTKTPLYKYYAKMPNALLQWKQQGREHKPAKLIEKHHKGKRGNLQKEAAESL